MTAYFITATGTDIGKTYVTAGLIRHLRGIGRPVSALKPVASGFTMEDAARSDPGQLLEAMGEPVTEVALDRIAPWRFAAPLSPDMAAAREGRAIAFDALLDFCRGKDLDRTLFIEGVGGVMVPLDARHTVRDWMAALGVPVILVSGSYLGTISHTLTALDVLARAGLHVAAIVLNESEESPVALEETRDVLARFAAAPIALMRRAKDASATSPDFARLSDLLDL